MSWRDHLPIHPAADLFPTLDDDELVALGEDIKRNGLMSPIVRNQGGRGVLPKPGGRGMTTRNRCAQRSRNSGSPANRVSNVELKNPTIRMRRSQNLSFAGLCNPMLSSSRRR